MPECTAERRRIGGQLRDAGVVEPPIVGDLVDLCIGNRQLLTHILARVGEGVGADHELFVHLFVVMSRAGSLVVCADVAFIHERREHHEELRDLEVKVALFRRRGLGVRGRGVRHDGEGSIANELVARAGAKLEDERIGCKGGRLAVSVSGVGQSACVKEPPTKIAETDIFTSRVGLPDGLDIGQSPDGAVGCKSRERGAKKVLVSDR